MAEVVDCVVIGAGVVGLAVARVLAQAGQDVVILERADAIGTGVSSRNSEVLHAGMYYPAGSLKAQFCAPGNRMLRAFMESHNVAHRMVGKLIVATSPSEVDHLETILARGKANGCDGLGMITRDKAIALEPTLSCTAALFSPSTGIIDTHGLMLALLGDAEAAGAQLALKSPVLGGEIADNGIVLEVGGDDPCRLIARRVVNAAGLGAQGIAAAMTGLSAALVPPLFYCKGNYFLLSGRQPFSRLVYPTPSQAGLGVHYTVDLGGQGRFGPDTEWIDEENYGVDIRRADVFYAAIRRYWPDLPDDSLRPGYSGIRPKISRKGEPALDFMIQGPGEHGIANLVNLFGIESPGLTSCLAIADHVAEFLK